MRPVLLVAAALVLSACRPDAPAPVADAPSAVAAPAPSAETPSVPVVDASLPAMTVYKTPTCGCCTAWVDHMKAAGFRVDVRDTLDLAPVKLDLGVPAGLGSCHTARVGDYVVEGHVPAADVKRLLDERPEGVAGIAVPGMPTGSPGMEVPGQPAQPYDVVAFGTGGQHVFASHR